MSSEKAPEGDYIETGEFRPPKEGEYFWSDHAQCTMLASYGRSEKRKIMKPHEKDKTEPPPQKKNAMPIDSDVQQLARLYKKAVETLESYMSGTKVSDESLRVAVQTLQIYSKMKSTDIQQKALFYNIIKDLSGSKEELRRLLMANVPEIKELTEGKVRNAGGGGA